jgi:hypothetical protein
VAARSWVANFWNQKASSAAPSHPSDCAVWVNVGLPRPAGSRWRAFVWTVRFTVPGPGLGKRKGGPGKREPRHERRGQTESWRRRYAAPSRKSAGSDLRCRANLLLIFAILMQRRMVEMLANRRRSERRVCPRLAKIQFGAGSLPRDCTITDISDGGVRSFWKCRRHSPSSLRPIIPVNAASAGAPAANPSSPIGGPCRALSRQA